MALSHNRWKSNPHLVLQFSTFILLISWHPHFFSAVFLSSADYSSVLLQCRAVICPFWMDTLVHWHKGRLKCCVVSAVLTISGYWTIQQKDQNSWSPSQCHRENPFVLQRFRMWLTGDERCCIDFVVCHELKSEWQACFAVVSGLQQQQPPSLPQLTSSRHYPCSHCTRTASWRARCLGRGITSKDLCSSSCPQ